MSKQKVNLISAMDINRGIGYKNRLPWHFKKDLIQFKRKTISCGVRSLNAVIMGRKTFVSLPDILPGRVNYVISRTLKGPYMFPTIESCLEECKVLNYETVWIIGGSEIYKYVLDNGLVDEIHMNN